MKNVLTFRAKSIKIDMFCMDVWQFVFKHVINLILCNHDNYTYFFLFENEFT